MLMKPAYRRSEAERRKIASLPRYTVDVINFLNKKLKIVDNASFLFIEKEVFHSNIYQFKTDSAIPFIIDCGANIGLSVIYFKQLYPQANLLAFEPDKKIFEALEFNCRSFNLTNVELQCKACWNSETTLEFLSEGADGGRTAQVQDDKENIVKVDTIRLRDYIDRPVDFLKIDIEGAEFTVLNDIADKLHYVHNLFVEYHSFIDKEQYLPEIITLLKNAGFRLYISSPGLCSVNPLMHLNTYAGMDGQLNIYACRSGK